MAAKYKINLLQAELLPEKNILTLSRVVGIWAVMLVIMVVFSVVTDLNHQELSAQYRLLKQEKDKQSRLVADLEVQIANRKVDRVLTEKLAKLKLLMKHKDALHGELTDPSRTFVTGFATAMDELSELHYQDISLQHIKINHDDMSFAGLAKSPEAVPAWLAGFEHSKLLSGKSFVHFKLSQNEQGVTEFVVSSTGSGATDNE